MMRCQSIAWISTQRSSALLSGGACVGWIHPQGFFMQTRGLRVRSRGVPANSAGVASSLGQSELDEQFNYPRTAGGAQVDLTEFGFGAFQSENRNASQRDERSESEHAAHPDFLRDGSSRTGFDSSDTTADAPPPFPTPLARTPTGLRSGGFFIGGGGRAAGEGASQVPPPPPPQVSTLDQLRMEVQEMRREAALRAAQERATQQRAEEARKAARKSSAEKSSSSLPSEPIKGEEYERITAALVKRRPVYGYAESHAGEAVAQKSEIIRHKLLNHADEVLRKKNKADTWRYVKLLFPSLGGDARGEVIAFCDELRSRVERKKEDLRRDVRSRSEVELTDAVLQETAWVSVLDELSDAELRKALQWGLVDPVAMTTPEAADKDDDDSDSVDIAEEMVEALQQVRYLQEMAATIQETELRGLPSEDLAPIQRKVELKMFEDISDRELRVLQGYEEKQHRLLTGPTHTPQDTVEQRSDTPTNTAPVAISEAAFDHVLTPSNLFLAKVAERDEKLHEALMKLERIKREALLDEDFQAAVRYAHSTEVESAEPFFLRDGASAGEFSPDSGDAASQPRTASRLTRQLQRRGGRNGRLPTAGQEHILQRWSAPSTASRQQRLAAADVPFFYGDPRSIVPPRGNFNLPRPKPTQKERAVLRKFSKNSNSRRRYSKP